MDGAGVGGGWVLDLVEGGSVEGDVDWWVRGWGGGQSWYGVAGLTGRRSRPGYRGALRGETCLPM